jgi:MraZ protein
MSTLSHGPFRGRFEIKLDPKGRLTLPQAFRSVLTGASPEIVITNSRYRGHSVLDVYSLSEWLKLEKRIARLSSLKAEVQAFNRFYLSGGQAVEVDAQNRVLVPQGLRRFASLEGEAVLVGLGGKFEIWAQPSWSAVYEQLSDGFEATLNAVAEIESAGERTENA